MDRILPRIVWKGNSKTKSLSYESGWLVLGGKIENIQTLLGCIKG
jgi:hypothetical protein